MNRIPINISKGQTLEFQIDGVTRSGEILDTLSDRILPDRTICIIRALFEIPVGSIILMPDIPMSGNCGVLSQLMAEEGQVAVKVPNSAIDPCSRGK